MQFRDRADYCRSLLRRHDHHAFRRNSRGVLQMSKMVRMLVRTKNTLIDIGRRLVFFTEQDPNSSYQPEAQLVRMGVWKKEDVGWLWTRLPSGKVCFLAKATPKTEEDLNPGWITEKGIFVVDIDYHESIEKESSV